MPCGVLVERGRRLVENDKPRRLVADREGARDLHHLAPADRQALHEISGRDAVAGEDFVELVEDEPAGAPAPAEAADAGMKHARVLRHSEIGAERKLLKYAANAERLGLGRAIGLLFGAADDDAAGVGRDAADQHMHERRLAGAVVADDPDALARGDVEADAVKGAHGAE